jgi:hypothetical protein
MSTPKYLRRKAAAEYLREHWGLPRAANTLAKLAVIGGGPIFRKAGRIPLYAPDDLDQYAEHQLGEPLRSTSDIPEMTRGRSNLKFHPNVNMKKAGSA